MLRAVLFDLDNTLVNFTKTKRACVDAALRAMIAAGLQLSASKAEAVLYTIYREKGIEYDRVFQDFLAHTMQAVDPHILARGIVAYRQEQRKRMQPYPGVVRTLQALRKRGLRLGIVSDAPALKVWIRLMELKLDEHFDTVVTLADAGKIKPAPEPFRQALQKLGIAPAEALYVGDRLDRDIIGARSVGMPTALAVYGEASLPHPFQPIPKPEDVQADYTLRSFSDLLAVVAKLSGASRSS